MSSNEEDLNDQDQPNGVLQGLKKRRIQRACDICRRKKIKCDGVQMPGNRCSNCVSYNYECTYVEAAKKRGPPKGYVESLENRLEKVDKLLRRLCPDESFLKELDGIIDNDSWVFDREQPVHPSPLMSGPANAPSVGHLTPQHPRDIATSVIRSVGANIDPEANDEDTAHIILADNLSRQLAVDTSYRFFGKSSGAMLVQTAIDIKNEYTGSNYDLGRAGLGDRRPEFWLIRPWERTSQTVEPPEYIFPDDDLITDLTDLYFQHVNLYLPLLHRPTFEKSLAEGLHRQNDMFGATLLLVCAVGSRFSHDPRVLLDGEESYHSCGWKWFDQVQMVKKSLLAPPSLYDLQFYCLSVQFLQGSSAPQSCWTMVGIGIRLAQDVGAHRRRAQTQPMTPEDELWKRAFWVLVCMDRMVSAALGRPCAIQDEDFDLDMPIECDDEYWDHPDPEKRFKQPPNKPSVLTAFILYLKLNQVLAFSLRTIYSINKSKILLGFVGQQWEQHIVAELDSALNKWVDSVPDHLRWDPNREDDNFFNQSVLLYASYYHIQILIHRPFIPSPKKPSPLSFPSLAICTNAARSCSHVVDMQRKRNPMPLPQVQMCVFTAGIVLLLSIWGGKRSGLSTDPNKEMADVYKCMQVLRVCEERWHSAGRLWDILYELASVGELPLPHSSPVTTNKRERDAESPMSAASICDSVPSGSISLDTPRNIAGLRRVSGLSKGHAPQQTPQPHSHVTGTSPTVPDQMYSSPLQPFQPENPRQSQEPSTSYQQENQQLFTLPVYSNELGRIPLHGQVKFSPRGQSPLDVSSWYPSPLSTAGDPMPSTSTMQSSFPPSDMMQGYSLDQSGMMFDQMGLSYQSGGAYDTLPYRNGVVNSVMSGTGVIQQQQPHEQSTMRYVPPQQTFVDNDTIAMWSNAPTGFELDEWGTYLTNVSELTQGHHPHGHIPNDV